MATPAQVRKLLNDHKLPFDISKTGSSWYVVGGECSLWYSQSLNTWKVSHWSAAKWVDEIVSMAMDNRQRVLESIDSIRDIEWCNSIRNSISSVDLYLEWKKKTAKPL